MRVFGFSDWTIATARTLGFHLTIAITWALWWYVGGIWWVFLGISLCAANKVERRAARLWRVHRSRVVSNASPA
jgi:hypothetical protein